MNPREVAAERIARASQRVQDAADGWNAVKLPAISKCISDLEHSAAELKEAVELVERAQGSTGNSIRANLEKLNLAAHRLERLVDVAAAFLRLAPGYECNNSTLYQAGGSICLSTISGEVRGIQV